ncbi:hypothetical protein [Bacillus atrophaeus]|uniref:Uncharacterized protein n=1 Tax=Bacillus atrophaeus (strain 1942) TaxID=720555 RepID=A0ABN3ZFB4_BACA1|nr:hypothetical protein [Bacillus atrophaeus]AMR64575.1 hypothetical protein A1D11_20250 [Bacillus subtilis subsp. globigii]ADP34535.1 hypothetical protein BATR1942_18090 [Bacillus atrophaeus 1942]AIK46115.1 hypothetical protein DJ95_3486 [Bacillus atrophaeus subsp. globigii]EIM11423.1 hypothetical protein UY9_06725 [Bacillus atrophaeus C89]KFK82356.1 hypothetical protein DK44_145 [Bacillus atrophaeus]
MLFESQKLGCELIYDESLTEQELLESIESIYNYIKQNPKEVTNLLNRFSMRDNNMTINLLNLGFEKAKS